MTRHTREGNPKEISLYMGEPAPPQRLIWVFEHANPYNIYLLNELNRRLPVPSEAIYVREHLSSHPWKFLPEREFDWNEYELPGRLSLDLLIRIVRGGDAVFLFNGWRDTTMRLGMWLCRLVRRSYVIWTDTPRAVESWTVFERLRRRVIQSFASGAVAVLGTGTPALERYAELGIDPVKTSALPWIVDLEHFGRAMGMRSQRSATELTALQVGRLVSAIKGQSVLLKALAQIAGSEPGQKIQLVFAGTGPDEERLRMEAAAAGLIDRVSFIGWIDYEELPAVFGQADVLVQPSFYDPYPVAVIEGMAAGLPILGSTACGSVRELVHHDVCGYHHLPGDADSLSSQLIALARDPKRRTQLAANARSAVEHWDIRYAERLLCEVLDFS